MAHPILMPKPGQQTEECTIVAWHATEGEAVHKGDVLFEIETDKANMDVEAFDEGVLLRRSVEVGETVPVGTVCGYVGGAGEALPADVPRPLSVAPVPAPAAASAAPEPRPAPAAAAAAPSPAAAPAPALPPAASAEGGPGRLRISPRASRLAADAGLDPRIVAGSGPGGRIVERDIQAALAAAAASAVSAAAQPAPSPAAVPAPVVVPGSPAGPSIVGEDDAQPMTRMRRVIAERLTASWTSTPHFTVTVAVDVTGLLALRRELKAGGSDLNVTDFILAATARTLVEFPDVNARTDGVSVWQRHRVHLGLAVSLTAGLVVPVIRDADWLAVADIHARAAELAAAARAGTLAVDDMTGSTFTVSNLGMFDVDEFSAIINPGEAAILAVSSAVETPVVIGGGIAVRSIMKLTLSADHRIVDGATGARFLNAVRRRLEDAPALRNWALGA